MKQPPAAGRGPTSLIYLRTRHQTSTTASEETPTMSTPTPLKRPGEDLVDERGAAKKARTSAPTPSASPPATTTTADTKHRPATPPRSAPQLPGLGMQQGSNSGGGSVTFPTPPSTAGLHGHTMASGAGSEGGDVESEQPTPTESEHRRTDHERKEEEQQPITAPVAPPPAKVLYKLHTERKYISCTLIMCMAC